MKVLCVSLSCLWMLGCERTVTRVLTLDVGGGVTIKLIRIPDGSLLMGSPSHEEKRHSNEGPQRRVTISKAFYMGIYEVTQGQYKAVMGKNPSFFQGASNPVEMVSWKDAVAFVQDVSRKTGRAVRLPTEAEWEYACRAGTTMPFYIGQTISTDEVNYRGDSVYGEGKKGVYRKRTLPVGSFKPNAWGLYDMHGNVWEWCADWYDKSYDGADSRDPQGPSRGTRHVVRGGSCNATPKSCRSAKRGTLTPDERDDGVGFRVVVSSVCVD